MRYADCYIESWNTTYQRKAKELKRKLLVIRLTELIDLSSLFQRELQLSNIASR